MASHSRTTLRRRLGILIAAAAVVTSLTAATAAAAPPAPMAAPAAGPTRPGAPLALGPMGSNDPEPGSRATAVKPADPAGGFIYRKGRYTPLDPLDGRLTGHIGINNRGQIVGGYVAAEVPLRGFLRNGRGDYTSFDAAPGATTATWPTSHPPKASATKVMGKVSHID